MWDTGGLRRDLRLMAHPAAVNMDYYYYYFLKIYYYYIVHIIGKGDE